MICRCCGSPRLKHHCECFDDRRLRYLRCSACGSLNLTTTYEKCRGKYHTQIYADQFVDYCKSLGKLADTFKCHLDGMESLLPDKGSVLDIGCAGGGFLLAAMSCGWEAWGFDVASNSRDSILRQISLPPERVVIAPEFTASCVGARFDVVHCSEVIEHVESPRRLLLEMRDATNDNGVVYVQTPTPEGSEGSIWNQDVHLCVMPEDALRWLLHDCGLEVDESLSMTWLRELDRPPYGMQPAGGQCYFCRKR